MGTDIIHVEKNARHCGLYVMLPDGHVRPAFNTLDWGWWHEVGADFGHYQIGLDWSGPMKVSTVFLGIDQSFRFHNYRFDRDGNIELIEDPMHVPILFETMVFGGTMHGDEFRYASLAAARLGHATVCRTAEEIHHYETIVPGSYEEPIL